MLLEPLEERIALSTFVVSGVHDKPLHAAPAAVRPLTNTAAKISPSVAVANVVTSASQLNADGTVTVTASDGLSTKVYQKVSKGWKLIAWNHQTGAGWTQETWGPDGSYEQDVWSSQQHGAVGAAGSISQTVVANGKMTAKLFHKTGGYAAFAYNFFSIPQWYAVNNEDATITWVYNVNSDGNRGAYQEYDLVNGGYYTNAAANWMLHPPSDWYTDPAGRKEGGWNQGFPGHHNSLGIFLSPPRFPDSISPNVRPEIVAVPPGVTSTNGSVSGKPAVTIFNQAHTQSLTFVYANDDEKDLIQRINGTYSGGNLVSSVSLRKAPDGQYVTFTGAWKSGTAIDNATGTETASNYLGFSSVTVQYQNGRPASRSGPLQGGDYAADTFNGDGTAVTKRQISNTMGGPVVQTWTGSENDLYISRNSPAPDIKDDNFHYVWKSKADQGYDQGYTLVNYNANFTKTETISVTPRTDRESGEVHSMSYNWRAYTNYSREDEDWNWNYREMGGYNASDSPNPQVGGYNEPSVSNQSHYWYQV